MRVGYICEWVEFDWKCLSGMLLCFHWKVDHFKISVSTIHQIERSEVQNSKYFLGRGSPSPLPRPLPLSRALSSIRALLSNIELYWNLIITLMLGSIRNQCYNRIVL